MFNAILIRSLEGFTTRSLYTLYAVYRSKLYVCLSFVRLAIILNYDDVTP